MIEEILLNQQLGSLGLLNFLKHSLRIAVEYGVSPEALVLLLLLPLLATIIALARYLFGVRGFGIFTPIMLSVAFLIAGLESGFFMFLIILGVATLTRLSIRQFKIHYLSRMAFLIWFGQPDASGFGYTKRLANFLQFEIGGDLRIKQRF